MAVTQKRIPAVKAFCILLIFLVFSSLNVFAGGKKDVENNVTLLEIDRAIWNAEYTDALEMCTRFIELYPEQFDSAKKRIDIIMTAKKNYNELERRLIELAANNPNEAEANYQLVLRLEKLEKSPSVLHQTVRDEVKNLTQFKACQQRFNEINENAVKKVGLRDFAGAADEYMKKEEGKQAAFEIYWQDFLELNTDDALLEQVNINLEDLRNNVAKYNEMQLPFQKAFAEYISLVNQRNFTEARNYFETIREQITTFAKVRNDIMNDGLIFEQLFLLSQQDNIAFTDASFLSFASKFVLGLTSEKNTGIVGAIDAQWDYLFNEAKIRIYEAALENSEYYASSTLNENVFEYPADFNDSRKYISVVKDYAELAIETNDLYKLILNRDGTDRLSLYKDYSSSMHYMISFNGITDSFFDEVKDVVSDYKKAESYKKPEDSIAAMRKGNVEYIAQLTESARFYTQMASKISVEYKLENNHVEQQPESVKSEEENSGVEDKLESAEESTEETVEENKYKFEKAVSAFEEINNLAVAYMNECAASAWKRIAEFYSDTGKKIASDYRSKLDAAAALIPPMIKNSYRGDADSNDAETDDSEENEEYTEIEVNDYEEKTLPQNPKLCISKIDEFIQLIPSDEFMLSNARLSLNEGGVYAAAFSDLRTEIDETNRLIYLMEEETNSLAERARKQYQEAIFVKNEGDLRYNQARQSLRRGEFEDARRLIVQARTKYSESLLLQNDAKLQSDTDQNLFALGEDISKAENEIVVREVRKLKSDARKAYYAGDFEYAETLLAQAETRWGITNVETDVELENLKAMVNTALSMKTGRVLLPTSPLYPEMSQILSIANQFYNEGTKLIKQKKKTQGTALLNQAQQKLNELKLVFPLNQEASILSLMIEQQLDPKSFQSNFAAKIESAKVNYKAADSVLKQQAYSDLVDLYEVNPDYPGLKDLIYNVEIELGLRKKPVDNSALVKANSLAGEAKRLLAAAGRDAAKIQKAKDKAVEALELNSENETAISVLDEIALRVGGQATVVLSAEDEELYQKAVLALQKNNIIAANTIVTQLLNKPSNKRSAKILELQKKVQSLL